MMQCPYCDESNLSDIDEINLHILKYHPDKTSLNDARENKTTRIWATAVELTNMSLGNTAHRKAMILKTFKFFLRELMKSE